MEQKIKYKQSCYNRGVKQIFFILFFFLFSASPAFAQTDWIINNFQSQIAIQPNGTVAVQETIAVDFYTLQKHGIYRNIPVVYEDDQENKTYTQIVITAITQDNQKANYQLLTNDNNLQIKIGDPDRTISGKHVYHISYVATGVLRSFEGHDELYWNATGNNWDATIEKASATITVPKDKIEKTTCYEGPTGSTNLCTITDQTPTSVTFANKYPLYSSYGLTVVVGYTKGMVPILTVAPPKTIWDDLFTIPSLIAFLVALALGIGITILVWIKKGRDFWFRTRRMFDSNAKAEVKPIGAHETVVVEYEPPENLRPAEIGVLMDEKADTLDVTATIIDLANRGFLMITELEKKWLFGSKDYELHRTKTETDKLLKYEKLLLNGLFASKQKIKVSELKTTFYDDLAKVKEALYQDVMDKKLFISNPESTRQLYIWIGIGIIVFGGLLIYLGFHFIVGSLVLFGLGIGVSGFVFVQLARSMPRRSAYGRELYQRIKGYELFIGTAEKYRQRFFEKKNMFNEVLPYAIVFGLTRKFSQAMKDMGIKPPRPTWYSGTHPFLPVLFVSDVNDFSKSLSTAIASTPSSSGGFSGGSSGGGFGGGGGGSW